MHMFTVESVFFFLKEMRGQGAFSFTKYKTRCTFGFQFFNLELLFKHDFGCVYCIRISF